MQKDNRTRLLVADDDESIRTILVGMLSTVAPCDGECHDGDGVTVACRPCFEVASVSDGLQAQEAVRQALSDKRPFSVVFLDVSMPPGPDGIVTAGEIRAMDPNIEIVMVTGLSDVDSSDLSRRVPPAGKLFYIEKPFHVKEIRQFAQALSAKWLSEKCLVEAHEELEAKVMDRTADLVKVNQSLLERIAEHSQARKALQKSEQQYRLLAENASDIIWLADMNLRFTFVSPAVERFMGYTPEEAQQLKFADVLTPTSMKMAVQILDDVLNIDAIENTDTPIERTLELEYVRKDGTTSWGEIRATLLRDENNWPVGLQGILRDLTERKAARRELALAGERWQDTFDAIQSWVSVLDRSYRVLSANRAMRETFADRQVVGGQCYELFHGTDKPCPGCVVGEVFKTGVAAHAEIQELSLGNRCHDVYAYPIKDYDGKTVQVVHIVNDITERKAIEKALRVKDCAIESAINAIAIADIDGMITYVNGAFVRMWAYENESEVLGKSVFKFWHDPDEITEMLQVLRKKGHWVGELAAKHHDGSRFDARVLANTVTSEDGTPLCMMASFSDITENKRAREDLQRHAHDLAALNTELERSNRDLEEFTYAVSHDLQEPLRKVDAFSQFLVEDCGDELSGTGKDYLNRMHGAVARMKKLIRHLLNLSRIGTRGGSLRAVDMRVLMNEVVDTLSDRARECGGEIVVAEDIPTVMADPVQMGRVLQNLIGNALKFRAPDRPPRVEVSASTRNGHVVFAISDNGIGIKAAARDKIFTVFSRLHTREEYDGDGVGLALCAKIVRRHGGKIWVESEVGKGSVFHFTLPRAKRAAESMAP